MGRPVDTNTIQWNFALEDAATPGAIPSDGWRALEPNDDGLQFGADITRTPRSPISNKLQRRKGTVTDLDSTTAFSADLTVDGLWDWIEAAIFAKSLNADVRDIPVTSVVGGSTDEFTIAAIGDAAAKIEVGTLLWADSFSDDGNNGLHEVSADLGVADTEIGIDDNLQNDADGVVSLAGARLPGKAGASWAFSSGRATLTYSAHGVTEARGLYLGQMVHFGSVAETGVGVQNGLSANTTVAGVMGFARLVERTADTLVFDRVGEDLQLSATLMLTVTAQRTDILFGDFIKNVPADDDLYEQRSHTVEQVSPGLGDGSGILPDDEYVGYEYAVGQVVGTLVLNFPLTDKATMDVSFVGQDTQTPVTDQKGGTGTPAKRADVDTSAPRRTEAMNTSSDFARLSIDGVDDDGLTSDFTGLTITINPQTTPEKVLGKLGARFISRGNLQVDTEGQVIFSDPRVIRAIRDNETLRFGVIFGNNDGVFSIEVPSQTIGGGGREYPANQKVLVSTTGESFEDEDFETSIHVSFFPVPIPTED